MESIYDKYHKINNIEEIYKNRINSELVVKLNLKITPMKQRKSYHLYYLPEIKHTNLLAEIYKNDQKLINLTYSLPQIAYNSFMEDTLLEELYITNEIEGVRSSRKEIYTAMEHKEKNSGKKIRFKSLINSYRNLLSGKLKLPESIGDIRKIYDFIVDDEISSDNQIDGKLFRLEEVEVTKQSGTGKVIHKGILGEDKIIIAINELLNFLGKEEINLIIKLAIFHYYFGYIHPFYDGNGRTARFITSLYLEKELSLLTAISLSTGILMNNKNYFLSFEKTNSFKNYGELNGFITMFLEVILSGQQKLLDRLIEKKELLEIAEKKIKNDFENSTQQKIVYAFAQQTLFGYNKEVVRSELCDFLTTTNNISKNEVMRGIDILLSKGIIEQTAKRPVKFKIKDGYLLTNDLS